MAVLIYALTNKAYKPISSFKDPLINHLHLLPGQRALWILLYLSPSDKPTATES